MRDHQLTSILEVQPLHTLPNHKGSSKSPVNVDGLKLLRASLSKFQVHTRSSPARFNATNTKFMRGSIWAEAEGGGSNWKQSFGLPVSLHTHTHTHTLCGSCYCSSRRLFNGSLSFVYLLWIHCELWESREVWHIQTHSCSAQYQKEMTKTLPT